MRVAGDVVFESTRGIESKSDNVVAGPDRADSVSIEVTGVDLLGGNLIRNFLLGVDYQPGDTILIVLEGNPEPPPGKEPPPVDNGNSNEPPPPPPPGRRFDLAGLAGDRKLAVGDSVNLNGTTVGITDGRLTVYADLDQVAGSGNEILLALREDVGGAFDISFFMPRVAPGAYSIYAEITDAEGVLRSAYLAGRLIVNAAPTLLIENPRNGTLIRRGSELVVAWIGTDLDDDARITIALDRDASGPFNGDEIVLRADVREDDLTDREVDFDTSATDGVWYVRGSITDGLDQTFSTNAPQIEITNRLVGRVRIDDLADGVSHIAGATDNVAFGASLAADRDLDGDGLADLIVGDPAAFISFGEGYAIPGQVKYHEQAGGEWPAELSADELLTTIWGAEDGGLTGARVALLAPLDGDRRGELAIAAPLARTSEQGDDGRIYFLNGEAARTRETIDLGELDFPIGDSLGGIEGEHAGLDLVGLGDLNGDGAADVAVGGTQYYDARGRIHLIGGGGFPSGDTGDVGNKLPGLQVEGANEGDLLGYAMRPVADVNGDGLSELVAAAPRGRDPRNVEVGPRTGVAYLVFGADDLFERYDGRESIRDLGDDLAGRAFVGENEGDEAGFALATGDFDGDGLLDLAIGAPGFDGGRGRVYLIFNIGDPALPKTVVLADAGGAIRGAKLDGLTTDARLGASLAAAGDFDGDGVTDLLMGAPGAEEQTGATLLVYGGLHLPGLQSIGLLGTIDLPGVEIVGNAAGNAFGSALSGGGALNGDEYSDFVVGAPGTAPGDVYVLFGRGKPRD